MIFQTIKKSSSAQVILRYLIDFSKNSNVHGLKHLARRDIHYSEFIFWLLILIALASYNFILRFTLIDLYNQKNVRISYDTNRINYVSTIPAFTFCNEPIEGINRTEEFNRVPKNYSIKMNGLSGVKILTFFGICYSFNSQLTDVLGIRSPEQQFLNNSTIIKQMLPSKHFKRQMKQFDYYTAYPITFKVMHNFTTDVKLYIHYPFEMPVAWSKPHAYLKHGEKRQMWLESQELVHDENFARITSINNRQCRTPEESNLPMFPNVYSRGLCYLNFRIQKALRLCGCLPNLFAIQFPKYSNCTPNGLQCLRHFKILEGSLHDFQCNCLPTCGNVYVKFIRTARLDEKSKFNMIAILEYPPNIQYQQKVYFTDTDYVVSLGSALSLLLGCSLLSLVDLIYYFSLRLFWLNRGYRGAVDDVQ